MRINQISWDGHVKIAKRLLEKVPDANQNYVNGYSLLHFAARKALPYIVKLILPKIKLKNQLNLQGETPLTVTQKRRCSEIANLISEEIEPRSGLVAEIGKLFK